MCIYPSINAAVLSDDDNPKFIATRKNSLVNEFLRWKRSEGGGSEGFWCGINLQKRFKTIILIKCKKS